MTPKSIEQIIKAVLLKTNFSISFNFLPKWFLVDAWSQSILVFILNIYFCPLHLIDYNIMAFAHEIRFNGIVLPKMKIVIIYSSFLFPLKATVSGSHWLKSFFPILWKSMGTNHCLVTHILQNIFFCFQQKEETRTVLKRLEGGIYTQDIGTDRAASIICAKSIVLCDSWTFVAFPDVWLVFFLL